MAPRPAAETPPGGLPARWTHVWNQALDTLKAQGTWAWELKPLLDEYVLALIGSEAARLADEHVDWDRHARRASSLADQLVLTDRARKALNLLERDERDPFEEFAGSPPGRRRIRLVEPPHGEEAS